MCQLILILRTLAVYLHTLFYPLAPWPNGKRYMARERVTASTNFYKQQADRLAHGPAGGGQIS
jgi:hypothetical protein